MPMLSKQRRAQVAYGLTINTILDYMDGLIGSRHGCPISCRVVSVEYEKGELNELLDVICGIDAILSCNGAGAIPPIAYSLALRFSNYSTRHHYPFNNFTIGVHEERKRLFAIKHTGIYPTHTIQVFMDEQFSNYMSFGIVATKTLYEVLSNGFYVQREGFKTVSFADINATGGTVFGIY